MLCHECQVVYVLRGQGRQVEFRFREVDPLFCFELRRATGDRNNLDPKPILGNAADRAADFAVIEEDRFTDADTCEDLWQRAGHEGWFQHAAIVVVNRIPAGNLAAYQVKSVTRPQRDPLLHRRQSADCGFCDEACLAPERQTRPGHDVRGGVSLAEAFARAANLDNAQLSPAAAGVSKLDAIAGLRFGE
jgi:hypothetical protein